MITCSEVFALLRRRDHRNAPISAITAIPPRVPPTIAPTCDCEARVGSENVGSGRAEEGCVEDGAVKVCPKSRDEVLHEELAASSDDEPEN